jgi:ergothioneine biosynthesis protein EgtB
MKSDRHIRMRNLFQPAPARAQPADLLSRYAAVRGRTVALASPLSAEDCAAQSMPDASPVKWHLAHTTWFFETFVLERHDPEFVPFHPAFKMLFNSYYQGVGQRHPRPQRGLLTRPSLYEVLAYRTDVDLRIVNLLRRVRAGAASASQASQASQTSHMELLDLVELGLNHEQQHQELLLTDVKHLLSCNPLQPAYDPAHAPAASGLVRTAQPLAWRIFGGELVDIGHAGEDFAFDNECPRHRVYVEPFALASRLVSCGEFAAFVESGGYQDPALWLAEGWDWRVAHDVERPLYWHPAEGEGWNVFSLAGLQPLDAAAPVVHLSYYEADAYARWVGARLPTEAQWELAAQASASKRPESHGSRPVNSGTVIGLVGARPLFQDLFGAAWQWTQSSYAPYPGFRVADGAVGEYNGKFMVNQYVLRGSSLATPPGHARTTYRNFFPATARWQFTGLRLARDV